MAGVEVSTRTSEHMTLSLHFLQLLMWPLLLARMLIVLCKALLTAPD